MGRAFDKKQGLARSEKSLPLEGKVSRLMA